MIVNSELSIEVAYDLNPRLMRVFDTSHYYSSEEVENLLLEVLAVNKDKWTTFTVKKGFSLVLNSSNLLYKVVGTSTDLVDLPDGIYEFVLSYRPNKDTLTRFNHLRITNLINKIYIERDKLINDTCRLSKQEYVSNRDTLRDIEEYVWAAKWKIEEAHDKRVGKEMYEWAVKQLEIYSNECKC